MSQANSEHTIAPAPETHLFAGTVFFDVADEAREGGHCYALLTATERLVVVWRKKRGPVLTRRLARRAPFNTYHFRDLKTGDVFELPCNKVSAIHAVAERMPA